MNILHCHIHKWEELSPNGRCFKCHPLTMEESVWADKYIDLAFAEMWENYFKVALSRMETI